MDTCGIPNKANWHIHVVLGAEFSYVIVPGHRESATDTTYTDLYICDEHMPVLLAAEGTVEMHKVRDPEEDELAIRRLLKWDGHEDWNIIEFTVTHLR